MMRPENYWNTQKWSVSLQPSQSKGLEWPGEFVEEHPRILFEYEIMGRQFLYGFEVTYNNSEGDIRRAFMALHADVRRYCYTLPMGATVYWSQSIEISNTIYEKHRTVYLL